MKFNYLNFLICLFFSLTGSVVLPEDHCPLKAENIIGDWKLASKSGPFEVMSFESEGNVFNSWLHDRPDLLDASWSFKNCEIQIDYPKDPKLGVSFRVISAHRTRLRIVLNNGSKPIVYRRIH